MWPHRARKLRNIVTSEAPKPISCKRRTLVSASSEVLNNPITVFIANLLAKG
jgi:hypothetical protein